jgi:hypothetical protein
MRKGGFFEEQMVPIMREEGGGRRTAVGRGQAARDQQADDLHLACAHRNAVDPASIATSRRRRAAGSGCVVRVSFSGVFFIFLFPFSFSTAASFHAIPVVLVCPV